MSPSLYVHVPFCLVRCAYCTFYSGEPLARREGYPRLVGEEARLRRDDAHEANAATIYLGGGTPSLLGAEGVGATLTALAAAFPPVPDAEITVEVNPAATLDFAALLQGGVTRVSVGVQSLEPRHLILLGRSHDAEQARDSIRRAVAAGLEVSADLMYGYAGLEPATLARDVAALAALGVHHLSAYALESPSPAPRHGTTYPPKADDEMEQRQWEALADAAGHAGFLLYETSNFCRPGHPSRHNSAYWRGGEYLGLGPGAHGFLPREGAYGVRYANAPDLDRWEAALAGGLLPPGSRETLTRDQALLERFFLRLRWAEPFTAQTLLAGLGPTEPALTAALETLCAQGDLAALPGGRYRPTPPGMRRADGLALWLRDRLGA